MSKDSEQSEYVGQFSGEIYKLLDKVTEGRENYYYNHPKPDMNSIPNIISECSTKNAAISFGLNLIPGPWGLITIIPELTLVLRNQLIMIYDIGIAQNKKKYLNKELLAGILISAFGSGTIGLITMQGSKVLVKRVSLRVFQKIITYLAGRITQSALKIFLGKFVPLFGAVLLAAWTRHMTRKVGEKAVEILSKDIEVEDHEQENIMNNAESKINIAETPLNVSLNYNKENHSYAYFDYNLSKERILTLINLMNIDGKATPEEEQYIEDIINNSGFNDEGKKYFHDLMKSKNLPINVDFQYIMNDSYETDAIIINLVTLAKRDGVISDVEKEFIIKIAEKLNVTKKEVEDLLEK